jgi:hypothetical protein
LPRRRRDTRPRRPEGRLITLVSTSHIKNKVGQEIFNLSHVSLLFPMPISHPIWLRPTELSRNLVFPMPFSHPIYS